MLDTRVTQTIDSAIAQTLNISPHHERLFFIVDKGFEPKNEDEEEYVEDALTETIMRQVDEHEESHALLDEGDGYTGGQLYRALETRGKLWFREISEEDFEAYNQGKHVSTNIDTSLNRALKELSPDTPLGHISIATLSWHRHNPEDADITVNNVKKTITRALR